MASTTSTSAVSGKDAVSAGTPSAKDDKKREATSPLYQDLTQKKTRHASEEGDEEGDDGTLAVPDDSDPVSPMQTPSDDVHVLSQPINPLDVIQIATELRLMMVPELKTLFAEQTPIIKDMVKTAVKEANSELDKQVKQLSTQVKDLEKENKRLTNENKDMRKRLIQVERDSDSLEQYSRRNSVRISGYPESVGEKTDNIVIKIAKELNAHISKDNIDRSHRVGKPTQPQPGRSTPRPRDILVKLSTYNARNQLYEMRKELRHSEDDMMRNLFINEDLTKKRSQLLYDARCLFRVENLSAAYSLDGRVFIRDNGNNRFLIQSSEDLHEFGDPKAARKELERLARQPPNPRLIRNAGNAGDIRRPDIRDSRIDRSDQNENS